MKPRSNFRGTPTSKTLKCPCGGTAKLRSRRNYPFGVKSTSISMSFYKCSSCGKETISKKAVEEKRFR